MSIRIRRHDKKEGCVNASSSQLWPKDQAKELLSLGMSRMESYHDHKETMAHAALLVQLAIAGGMLAMDPWPPTWVPALRLSSKTLATAMVLIIAFLVHVYMRWQLQRRRAAALYVGAILKVLLQWGYRVPTDEELRPWPRPPSCPSVKVGFGRVGQVLKALLGALLDSIITWKSHRVFTDEGLVDYPAGFVKELLKAETGAMQAERLVTYGSLLLMVIVLVRGLS
jgi:hypothetical protein